MAYRVLVANRGEIAVRIIRACHDLGWTAIAVHSDVDTESLHVALADEAVQIGSAQASESYLSVEAILKAAAETSADAVHPGYGFLAENADFAEAVIAEGLRWVGPAPDVIRMMGDKSAARLAAQDAGVPVVPGSAVLGSLEEALAEADRIGYPVLIKASAGGGGKGIRTARDADELTAQYEEARHEVAVAFGDEALYVEKSLPAVRHIEVQVLGDHEGKVVHLHERECSLQRRRQKLIEEAPATSLPVTVRAAMHDAAVRLARSVGYTSAGTVEFLADDQGSFYFIEMNTRIQVEHGVTELLTGIDLVAAQLRIAFERGLPLTQQEICPRGAVIELRVNAENPSFHFFGSPGEVSACRFAAGTGIRVDSGVEAGDVVQPFYDSMVAKILVAGHDRTEAIARSRRAVRETVVEGPITTLGFIEAILRTDWFADADFDTTTLEAKLDELVGQIR